MNYWGGMLWLTVIKYSLLDLFNKGEAILDGSLLLIVDTGI